MTNIGFAPTPFNPLFAQLAMPQAQLLSAAAQIPMFAMPTLLNAFQSAGSPAQFPGAQIPGFMAMPSPTQMMPFMSPIAGGGYAQQQRVDLAPGHSNSFFARIFDPARRDAAKMEKVLKNDPFARQAFEQAIGGRIVDFGSKTDGKFTVERFTPNPYAQALGGGGLSPLASQLGSVYQQMNQGIVQAGMPGFGSIGFNPFPSLALGGFTGMASQLLGAGQGPGQFASFGSGVQGAPLFGTGQASWNPLAQPGKIQGTNAGYEGAHSAQVHSVLSDPSLTMEDKIMLALMLICSKMDDDIKRQTEYINQLQNQQGNRTGKKGGGGGVGGVGGGKAGGKAGGAGGKDGEKSIDLETKKLERMITKRSQLFDTLGKIMERYDQSAKNVIQSMRG